MVGGERRAQLARRGALVAAVTLLGVGTPVALADVGGVPTSTVTVPVLSIPTVTVPGVTDTVAPPRVNLTGPVASPSPTPKAGSPGSGSATTRANFTSPSPRPPDAPPVRGASARRRQPATPTAIQVKATPRDLAVRLRRAAAETVQQLTFPVGLVLAMLAFLVFQHRVDKGDPRIEESLESGDDDLLGFS